MFQSRMLPHAILCTMAILVISQSTARAQCERVLSEPGPYTANLFGGALAVDDDDLFVGLAFLEGDPVHAAVIHYRREGNEWIQDALLTEDDITRSFIFGRGLALSGDTLAVAATGTYNPTKIQSGAAYVFVKNAGVWSKDAMVLPDDPASEIVDKPIALSQDFLAFQVHELVAESGQQEGQLLARVYVFRRDGAAWVRDARLLPHDPDSSQFNFGWSLALNGSELIVGTSNGVPGQSGVGAAYVYQRADSEWSLTATLVANENSNPNSFSISLVHAGDRIVVGAPTTRDPLDNAVTGAAYIFHRNGSEWVPQATLLADDRRPVDYFGSSVAISQDTLIVGAMGRDGVRPDTGAAYVFRYQESQWVQTTKLSIPDSPANDLVGAAVAIDGDQFVLGTLDQRDGPGLVYTFPSELDFVTARGDVNRDGDVDIFDIFCVLDGFLGQYNDCPLQDVDIRTADGSCGPDGTVTIHDILAVLDGFLAPPP